MSPYPLVLEAVEHLATIVFMIRMLMLAADLFVALTLSLDLLIIVATVLAHRYTSRHLLLGRMARPLGFEPPYSEKQRRRLRAVFDAGYQRLRAPADERR